MSDTANDIADAADALTDPHQSTQTIHSNDGNHSATRRTVIPSLIEQLRRDSEPGNNGEPGGRGGPESVPVAIDAVSLLGSIEAGAAARVSAAIQSGLRIDLRDTPEGNIRALVGVASRLPYDRNRVAPYTCSTCPPGSSPEHWLPCHHCQPTTQRELLSELNSWRRQAEIITGWETPPKELLAPCPACDARGTLLANPDPANLTAQCTGCGQRWCEDPTGDDGHIGLLARHVTDYQDLTWDERREYRRAAVEARLRSEGKPSAQAA